MRQDTTTGLAVVRLGCSIGNMLSDIPQDYAREQAASKNIAAQKTAAIDSVAIAIEQHRVEAAATIQRAMARETDINSIPTLAARVTVLENRLTASENRLTAVENRAAALDNRIRSSAELLDAKIVDFDTPLHWLKQNVWTVVGLILANTAVSALLFRLLR
jgi:hypothetical protein